MREWGNIPRVLLSACAVIKREKPVIIVAYTPAGRRARLRTAMQIRSAPCSWGLCRHWRRTLQMPHQRTYKNPVSLGAPEARSTVYVSNPVDVKVKGMCGKREDSWRRDKGRRTQLHVRGTGETAGKGYEERISNTFFGLHAACVRSAAGVGQTSRRQQLLHLLMI